MGTHPIFESDFDCLTEKMNLFVGNQRILVFTQVTFILFDLCVNMFIDLFAKDPVLKLVTLVFQLIILLLSLLLVLLVLFNTYPVQTGQFRQIVSKFKAYYTIFAVYLLLTVILNSLKLSAIWEDPFKEDNENDTGKVEESIQNLFNDGFYSFIYCIQRLTTPIYYYATIRSCVRIGDLRFYSSTLWTKYYAK